MRFAVPVAVSAAITLLVTVNIEAIGDWWSSRNAIESEIVEDAEGDAESFGMVVPDPARLDPAIASATDCRQMRRLGEAAGGVTALNSDRRRIVLTGQAKGTVITEIRAVTTERSAARDGIYIGCRGEGEGEPTSLQFDLTRRDRARGLFVDRESREVSDRFAGGTVIKLAENESHSIHASALLPDDAVRWHIEVVVLGRDSPVIVDDNGRDFASVGRRGANRYRAGYEGVAGRIVRWGVVPDSQVRVGSGGERLTLGPVSVPNAPGTDFYKPDPNTGSPHRRESGFVIRRGGAPLLNYDEPGRPVPIPTFGTDRDYCSPPRTGSRYAAEGIYRTAVIAEDQAGHPGERIVRHRAIDLVCNYRPDSRERDGAYSGAAPADDDFWHCGGPLCPEVTHRLEVWTYLPAGGGPAIEFWIWHPDLTTEEIGLAQRLMAEVLAG